jgi:hypothetical protein
MDGGWDGQYIRKTPNLEFLPILRDFENVENLEIFEECLDFLRYLCKFCDSQPP